MVSDCAVCNETVTNADLHAIHTAAIVDSQVLGAGAASMWSTPFCYRIHLGCYTPLDFVASCRVVPANFVDAADLRNFGKIHRPLAFDVCAIAVLLSPLQNHPELLKVA
jgi:hypothetical protein